MSDPVIGDQQRRDFAADGFVAFPEFIRGDELAELLAHVRRFIQEVVPSMPPEHVFYEDKNDAAR